MLRGIELTGTKDQKLNYLFMVVLKDLSLFRGKIIGGQCGGDTPRPMPNLEVKTASVDGTVRGTYGREDRCQFRLEEEFSFRGLFFVNVKMPPLISYI